MSVKRSATTDLNHENWDKEDPAEHEEMGSFKTATKDVLEKRVIRTAKRRSQVSSDEPKKSVFGGFSGFNKPAASSFDFLANLTNGSKNTNGTGTKSETAVTSSLFSSKPMSPSGGLFGIPTSNTTKPAYGVTPFQAFTSTPKTETTSMTLSSSKADSTVGDPFKIQSVSSSADSDAQPIKAPQVSSTIFGVSSTSPNQNKSPAMEAFKQPVSSSSTAVQYSAVVATQSSSNSNEPAFDKETEIEKARNKYYSKLKGLNESVSSWIVKHVEKTPLCFLTPIFKDYSNYLKEMQETYESAKAEIEAKQVETMKPSGTPVFSQNQTSFSQDAKITMPTFGTNTTTCSTSISTPKPGLFGTTSTSSNSVTTLSKGFPLGVTSSPPATNIAPSSFKTTENTTTSPIQAFSFGVKPTSPAENSTSPNKAVSFGITSTPTTKMSTLFTTSPTNTVSPPSKGFSFGNTPSSLFSSAPPEGISFGRSTPAPAATSPSNTSAKDSTPFTFGIGSGKPFSFSSQIQQQSLESNAEKEDDQPPKVEYTPITEENSVYEKKCKIFVKKDVNFTDKGVGTLYVKKVEGSGKHQLLVRANTNLGSVLLNLILVSSVPTQRMGKNNVMLVCIPTSDAQPPPIPVLIRVKTSEEADELLETLNKYKS